MSKPEDIDSIDIDFEVAISEEKTAAAPAPVEKTPVLPVDDIIETVEKPKPLEVKPLEVIAPVETSIEETPSVVSEVLEALGYVEDFKDEEFEDSTAGIVKLTKAAGDRIATETLDRIFESHPTVKAHLDYVMNGGDPNKFMSTYTPEKDYAQIKIEGDTAESKALAKSVLTDYFKAKGNDPDFINDMIEAYEDKGEIVAKGNAAAVALAKVQASERENLVAEQRREAQARQVENEKVWKQVTEIVTKAPEIGGIPIAEKERAKFHDYISKPVDAHGRTQRDIDVASATLEQQLAIDFLMYKKLDMGTIIAKKAQTTAAVNLRDRLKAVESKTKGARGLTGSTNEVLDTVDLDTI